MNNFGIRPGIARTAIDQLEKAIGGGATNAPQRQSPAARNVGGTLNGLSNFRSGEGAPPAPPASPLPRSFAALPGQTRGLGSQLASTMFHAGSQFLPAGRIATAMHAAGDILRPSALASGDPTTQMAAMQEDFQRQQAEMTRLNNKNAMESAVTQQSVELTSALASIGNKGVSNIAKAASGQ